MSKSFRHRVLAFGLLSPVIGIVLYVLVYSQLTELSRNPKRDWAFRLSLSALAMTLPFLFTLRQAINEGRRQPLSRSSKIGLAIALLSLALVLKPVSDGILRVRQSRNLALRDEPAPVFDTPDISGNPQRLADHRGEVVLVNIWATWCGPCREEMFKLDELYRTRKVKGFVVFGFSDESIEVQRKFLQQVSVSYPLLTLTGRVPSLYRNISQYPAIFLIDRRGRLQPAPHPGQPFEKVAAAVDALLLDPPR